MNQNLKTCNYFGSRLKRTFNLNPAIQLVCKCADTIFYYRQIFFSFHLLIFIFALQIDHVPSLTSSPNLVDLLGWFVTNLLISKTASRKKNSITNMSYSMNSIQKTFLVHKNAFFADFGRTKGISREKIWKISRLLV